MLDKLNTTKYLPALVAFGGLCLAPLLGYGVTLYPSIVLAGVAGAIIGYALVRHPIWAVYVLVVGTSFDSVSIRTGLATFGAADLASLILVPVWLLNRLTSKTAFHYPLGLSILVGYFAITFVSLMAGVSPSIAFGNYARLLIYGLTLLAVVDIVRNIETVERILLLMALCGLAQAVIGLAIGQQGGTRLSGLVEQPNLLAVKIAFGLFPMAGWLMRSRTRLYRTTIGICLFVMVLAILLTISRGSYIAVVLGFLWWFRRARRTAAILLVTGGIAVFALSRFDTSRVNRIEGRLEFNDSSVVNRAIVAQNAMRAALARPLLGVGFGQFSDIDRVISVTAEKRRGAHSFYLSLAASCGLPALLLFLSFVYLQWRNMSPVMGRSPPKFTQGSRVSREAKIRWIVSVFQPLMICHAAGLTIRGSQRLTEWTMLSLYCAVALIAHRYSLAQKKRLSELSDASEAQLGEPQPQPNPMPLVN